MDADFEVEPSSLGGTHIKYPHPDVKIEGTGSTTGGGAGGGSTATNGGNVKWYDHWP